MAKRDRAKASDRQKPRPLRFIRRWLLRIVGIAVILALALVGLFSAVNPPVTPYMLTERARLGPLERDWVSMEEIAPVMARSAVAAEDADFCRHWGFDLDAIEAAIAAGADRGASTISQQTVKNVYLWHGRSWVRKALEAGLTPAVEGIWSKRRILEVYLNVAEFDEGVFGVEAAAQHYFGVPAAELDTMQAARLAAILPNPKGWSATETSPGIRDRAAGIADGAATIERDGRAACFESGSG